jgi:hypothetical protein
MASDYTDRTQDIISDHPDLERFSDPAKRAAETRAPAVAANTQQNLDVATGKRDGEIQSTDDRISRHLVQKYEGMMPVEQGKYMQSLGTRLVDLKKQADTAKKAGNIPAFNTFMQVYNVLQQHQHSLLSQHAADLVSTVKEAAGGQ